MNGQHVQTAKGRSVAWNAPTPVPTPTSDPNVSPTPISTPTPDADLPRVTIKCTIDDKPKDIVLPDGGLRDDAPITRETTLILDPNAKDSDRSTDPGDSEWNPNALKYHLDAEGASGWSSATTVAAGNINTPAHKVRLRFKVTYADGRVAGGKSVEPPSIISGGRGPTNETVTARVNFGGSSVVTDANGEIFGEFLSGHRLEETIVGWPSSNGEEKPSVAIEQVWNDMLEGNGSGYKWDYDPYFDFNTFSSVKYSVAYQRGSNGTWIPVDFHHLQFETTGFVGQVWDPAAGPDEDGNGQPDGDYVQQEFAKGDVGFNAPVTAGSSIKRNDLIMWSPPVATSSTGQYTTNMKVTYNDYFVVDSVDFTVYDNDSFGPNGDTGE